MDSGPNRLVGQNVALGTTAGVELVSSYQDLRRASRSRLAINETLSPGSKAMTNITLTVQVNELVCQCHQLWHVTERLAPKVEVESGNHKAVIRGAHTANHKVHQITREELTLFEGD